MDAPSVLSDPPLVSQAVAPPSGKRRIGDPTATRDLIYSNALKAATELPAIGNARHTLSLHDVGYSSDADFSLAKQKQTILGQRSLTRRLQGTWRLTDTASGKVMDEKRTTVANVPHLTNRGTFILDGSEFVIANQLRLLPGVYTRRKSNGELEAHVNVHARSGPSHRIYLDPETGVFRMKLAQAQIPVLPILRAMGATDQELTKAWGHELLAANYKYDSPQHLKELHDRIVRAPKPGESHSQAVAEAFNKLELDPEVTKRTLGKAYTQFGKEPLLKTTAKILALNRREVEPDDRDHMAFQRVVGPEDLIAERFLKDRPLMQKMLWQSSYRGKLERLPSGAFDRAIRNLFFKSGIAQTPEGISAAEFIDHASRITRLGEGGLTNKEAIPEDSRNVHPSQFGFIDPIKTPEAESAGVDLRLAYGVQKGEDGRLYAPFRDAQSGRLVYRSPQQLSDSIVAFPGELAKGQPHVAAISNGRMMFVPRERVNLEAPSMENTFSPLSNLLPLKSTAKGQRGSMGARMIAQSLPLREPESPLVRNAVPGYTGKSYEELYGSHMGVVRSKHNGVVESVTPDEIKVHHEDGTKQTHELYNNWGSGRKTGVHNTALVKPGDAIAPGQVLAKSNFTNDQGEAALGVNARVAYVPFKSIYDDSAVISESFAKRLTSEHYYQHKADFDDSVKTGKNNFISLFPGKYEKKLLDNYDADGAIKPGTEVKPGEPLVLMAKQKATDYGKVTRSSKGDFTDSSLTWEHHNPGIVTDVVPSRYGTNVVVKSYAPMQIGDKLCYDAKTEVLTLRGWKLVSTLSADDMVCCLVDGKIKYQKPTRLYSYPEGGRMYRVRSRSVDLLVTDNHRLYVQFDGEGSYRLAPATEVFGKKVKHLKTGIWDAPQQELIPMELGEVGGLSDIEHLSCRSQTPNVVPSKEFATLVAGYLTRYRDGYKHDVRLYANDDKEGRVLTAAGRACGATTFQSQRLRGLGGRIGWDIHNSKLHRRLKQIAACRAIPSELLACSPKILQQFLYWVRTARPGQMATKGWRMLGSLQHLALHAGLAVDCVVARTINYFNGPKSKLCKTPRLRFCGAQPEINGDEPSVERWIEDYDQPVYCVEVPEHVIYVRRNGKAVWCGNSNRFGGKSIVSDIVPDHQMPHSGDGQPFEMAWSPLSLNSRINPAWVIEAALGKVAAKTGKPYILHDFGQVENWAAHALQELNANGMSDTETIVDPTTGRKIPDVLTGTSFLMKLHHQSEGKASGRGLGAYSSDGTPTKGGGGGARRLSMGDANAMLSHGALEVLRDAKETRGQKNDEFWLAYMSGFPTPPARIPQVYDKFLTELKASGINVVREDGRMRLMALTSKDVSALTGNRELQNAETVNLQGLKPIRGGLFDEALTGGREGGRWSKITLAEPMPNPVFAEPIRKLLGLTNKQFLGVLAGQEMLGGATGPKAMVKALGAIDVKSELAVARQAIASGRKTQRDTAIRKLNYLKSMEKSGLIPKDWILDSVPVLPPQFRPISQMSGKRSLLVADPNTLYKDLFEANQNLKAMHGKVDDLSHERTTLYKAFEAVTGLGDPVSPKNVEQGVQGILQGIFGSSPKYSQMQMKLLGTTVDLAGRAVISPDPDLHMDSVGLPEEKAFDVYRPFVVRELVRKGMPKVRALQAVEERTHDARQTLISVMAHRPVIVNRYPLLHRYGEIALYPQLAKGDVIRLPPIVYKGMGADNDGDTSQFHVPFSAEAVRDAAEKMLPSRNLFHVSSFKATSYIPLAEHLQGLHAASTAESDSRPRVFADKKSAISAYQRGELGLGQRVQILG